ncbi:hypothetical protein J6590_095696 [Homalodisca vitripennis]|nr:hypothetical protein J6590_095696 [Homalodisca vitripennis]
MSSARYDVTSRGRSSTQARDLRPDILLPYRDVNVSGTHPPGTISLFRFSNKFHTPLPISVQASSHLSECPKFQRLPSLLFLFKYPSFRPAPSSATSRSLTTSLALSPRTIVEIGWSYVSIVYEESNYGIKGTKYISRIPKS